MSEFNEVVAVAGCSRCGSTLMMQALEAGGMPVYHGGNRVGYECDESQEALVSGSADFLRTIPGHAVKLLDPQRVATPCVPIAWIWMWRDAEQQALSQIKFMGQMFSLIRPDTKRLAASLRKDNERVPVELSRRPKSRVLVVDFARLLAVPDGVMAELVGFINRPMDIAAMARVVQPRGPECAVGLDIELRSMKERGDAALAAKEPPNAT